MRFINRIESINYFCETLRIRTLILINSKENTITKTKEWENWLHRTFGRASPERGDGVTTPSYYQRWRLRCQRDETPTNQPWTRQWKGTTPTTNESQEDSWLGGLNKSRWGSRKKNIWLLLMKTTTEEEGCRQYRKTRLVLQALPVGGTIEQMWDYVVHW